MKLKSILPLIFLSFILISCSSEDSSETSEDDAIIGTWGKFEYLEEDGRIREVDPRLSENQMTFHSDGTVSSHFFDGTFDWHNIGNGTYALTVKGESAEGEKEIMELLNNGILKSEYGNGEATFLEKVQN